LFGFLARNVSLLILRRWRYCRAERSGGIQTAALAKVHLWFIINRSGNFLYLVGFTPSIEYFTVYSLTAAGVPNPKPVQTLTVKPSLHQVVIHPNGLIAYGMFSWSQIDSSRNTVYAGDAVLFKINPKTGMLTNTMKNVKNFPLNEIFTDDESVHAVEIL
jgi:hypothetical protein